VPVKLRMISIKVKGESAPRMQPTFDTEFGPAIDADMEHNVAYAASSPYLEDTGMLEQSYAMVQAKTAEEFRKALGRDSLMEQNITFADRDGNIGYVRVGRTPKRPEGFDWNKPVPGNTSKSKYLGVHDIADHVQIMNPASGYMQNCNVSPQNMMANSPMTPDKYVSYLYNVSWDKTSPRGERLLQLLDKNASATREEAMAMAMDVYDLLAEPWKKAIAAAAAKAGQDLASTNAKFAEAVDLIAKWDGQFVKESTAATLMWRVREKIGRQVDVAGLAAGKALTDEEQKKLVQAIADVVAEIQKTYKKFPVAWGETHVVGRDGKYFPYDGADFGRGAAFTETVRDVETHSEDPEGSGRYVANSGSMAAMIMFFTKEGIDSFSCTPWGISADPKSPHHVDQAEKLYSQRKFKPSWWKRADLEGHIESERVLTAP
jgi:acyl-homoserine lactone acylase PvdQ